MLHKENRLKTLRLVSLAMSLCILAMLATSVSVRAKKRIPRLSVKGTKLVNKRGKAVQLKGVSTHGIAWYPQYVNKKAFKSLQKRGANLIRLSLYTAREDGYNESWFATVDKGVRYATELGMYVIIDWHILSDGNPKTNQAEAEAFFERMAKKYQGYVIYEICNEPNGDVTWERDVKPYALDVIKVIRKYAKDAVIIVGTPTWSQDVDVVAESPIEGEKNLMYALHFYAATHKQDLRDRSQSAIDKGLPIFVSEFSICDASGTGGVDYAEANQWMKLIRKNKLGYAAWNLSNKNETSALIDLSCDKTSNWKKKEYSTSGKWLLKQLGR